jgi:hypothetical protein
MKPWYTSRTVILAVLQAIVSIITAVLTQDPALQGAAALLIVKSAADLALRVSTTQPII